MENNGFKVTACIVPKSDQDKYPVTNPIYGLGGLRLTPNNLIRDSISVERREEGMLVYTADSRIYWKLESDLITWSATPFDFTIPTDTSNNLVSLLTYLGSLGFSTDKFRFEFYNGSSISYLLSDTNISNNVSAITTNPSTTIAPSQEVVHQLLLGVKYTYFAFASDDQGSDFNLQPSSNLEYLGILNSSTPYNASDLNASVFSGLWIRYASKGTNIYPVTELPTNIEVENSRKGDLAIYKNGDIYEKGSTGWTYKFNPFSLSSKSESVAFTLRKSNTQSITANTLSLIITEEALLDTVGFRSTYFSSPIDSESLIIKNSYEGVYHLSGGVVVDTNNLECVIEVFLRVNRSSVIGYNKFYVKDNLGVVEISTISEAIKLAPGDEVTLNFKSTTDCKILTSGEYSKTYLSGHRLASKGETGSPGNPSSSTSSDLIKDISVSQLQSLARSNKLDTKVTYHITDYTNEYILVKAASPNLLLREGKAILNLINYYINTPNYLGIWYRLVDGYSLDNIVSRSGRMFRSIINNNTTEPINRSGDANSIDSNWSELTDLNMDFEFKIKYDLVLNKFLEISYGYNRIVFSAYDTTDESLKDSVIKTKLYHHKTTNLLVVVETNQTSVPFLYNTVLEISNSRLTGSSSEVHYEGLISMNNVTSRSGHQATFLGIIALINVDLGSTTFNIENISQSGVTIKNSKFSSGNINISKSIDSDISTTLIEDLECSGDTNLSLDNFNYIKNTRIQSKSSISIIKSGLNKAQISNSVLSLGNMTDTISNSFIENLVLINSSYRTSFTSDAPSISTMTVISDNSVVVLTDVLLFYIANPELSINITGKDSDLILIVDYDTSNYITGPNLPGKIFSPPRGYGQFYIGGSTSSGGSINRITPPNTSEFKITLQPYKLPSTSEEFTLSIIKNTTDSNGVIVVGADGSSRTLNSLKHPWISFMTRMHDGFNKFYELDYLNFT